MPKARGFSIRMRRPASQPHLALSLRLGVGDFQMLKPIALRIPLPLFRLRPQLYLSISADHTGHLAPLDLYPKRLFPRSNLQLIHFQNRRHVLAPRNSSPQKRSGLCGLWKDTDHTKSKRLKKPTLLFLQAIQHRGALLFTIWKEMNVTRGGISYRITQSMSRVRLNLGR